MTDSPPPTSPGTYAALRLLPGDDLIGGLDRARAALDAHAVAVVACIGSLHGAVLRFADRPEGTALAGPLEILSLTGTLDPGGRHLHAALSDAEGRVRGGHLMPGAVIRTTAEIVLLRLDALAFARVPCPRSGYRELAVSKA